MNIGLNVAIGDDGTYIRVQSSMIAGWEKCESIGRLERTIGGQSGIKEARLSWIGPKLPSSEFEKVLGTVAKFPKMEVGFVLGMDTTTGSLKVLCPEQSGSGGNVGFLLKSRPEGFIEMGTIHTHPEMSAFWSGTDMSDGFQSDGVHIVLGLRSGKAKQTKCSIFTTSHTCCDIDIWDFVEKTDLEKDWPACDEWVSRIEDGMKASQHAGTFAAMNEFAGSRFRTNELVRRNRDPFPLYGSCTVSYDPYGFCGDSWSAHTTWRKSLSSALSGMPDEGLSRDETMDEAGMRLSYLYGDTAPGMRSEVARDNRAPDIGLDETEEHRFKASVAKMLDLGWDPTELRELVCEAATDAGVYDGMEDYQEYAESWLDEGLPELDDREEIGQ